MGRSAAPPNATRLTRSNGSCRSVMCVSPGVDPQLGEVRVQRSSRRSSRRLEPRSSRSVSATLASIMLGLAATGSACRPARRRAPCGRAAPRRRARWACSGKQTWSAVPYITSVGTLTCGSGGAARRSSSRRCSTGSATSADSSGDRATAGIRFARARRSPHRSRLAGRSARWSGRGTAGRRPVPCTTNGRSCTPSWSFASSASFSAYPGGDPSVSGDLSRPVARAGTPARVRRTVAPVEQVKLGVPPARVVLVDDRRVQPLRVDDRAARVGHQLDQRVGRGQRRRVVRSGGSPAGVCVIVGDSA